MGHVTNLHYDCVYNPYSTSISTHLEYLLRSNEIQVCFSLFSQRGCQGRPCDGKRHCVYVAMYYTRFQSAVNHVDQTTSVQNL